MAGTPSYRRGSLDHPDLPPLLATETSLRRQEDVTPSFKGKTKCIDYVCARIKLHTHNNIVNTKISATRIKSYYMTKVAADRDASTSS
jgi:hypothetical protein